jgi:hypothetical protein
VTIERYNETIPAIGAGVGPIERGPGNFFLLLSSTNPVNVRLHGAGVSERFDNVVGGIVVRRVRSWANLRLEAVAGTQCIFFYGTELVDKDDTDIRIQIAALTGVSAVADVPSGAVTDTAPVVCNNAVQTNVAAVNQNRRRVTLAMQSTASGTVFVRKAGGVNNLIPLAPGAVLEFKGTYALDVRNDSGAAQTVYVLEET